MSSIFSKIIRREIPAYIVKEDEDFIAFLDAFPLQRGHVLVVPKKEVDKIYDLEAGLLSKYLVFAQPIAHAIEKAFPCERVGMSVVGLEVPHAHLHLIPINQMSDLDFTQKKLALSPEEMEAIRKDIIQYL
ncbi:MAG TPA: HIT family protein [Chitinophagaceae bacterium]|nr:HIT family protein [Chitinophagaceae bacterium]